jgi:hypothetical protein
MLRRLPRALLVALIAVTCAGCYVVPAPPPAGGVPPPPPTVVTTPRCGWVYGQGWFGWGWYGNC